MDTYENENVEAENTENTEVPQSRPENPEETVGVYHAQGAGRRESMYADASEYTFRSYAGQGVYQRPAQFAAAETVPADLPRESKKLRFWKRAVAAILVVALVVSSCCVTAAVLNGSWRNAMTAERKYLEEQIAALQKELGDKADNLGGEIIVSPQEGLTPAQVYQQNLQSVVAISCTAMASNEFGQSYVATSSGSGFILTADGYVVTNHHVIQGATEITVITSDDLQHKARLVGSDASNDIALLKVEVTGWKPVTIGSSNSLAVGSQVVAIGNALGELSASLTVGYISGKDRTITTDGTVINMLQTDASINAGNSGGPLFNMRGEVIGITTAKYSGSTASGASIEGIGFAIPVDDVIGMLEDLRDYGYITGVQMGVMVSNVDPEVSNTYGFPMGAYVESVVNGSCAQKAGIQAKDIILSVGGYRIETLNDLTRALRNFKAGQEATVKVWRGGREVLLTIVFDAKPQG